MTSASELRELLLNGENSGVEYKRDDIKPVDLARAICALANLRGGRVLLGVEDDGTASGLVRDRVDEWVVDVARDKLRPPLIPFVETMRDQATGRQVAVVTVEPGFAVHAVWHDKHYSYYVRAGRTTREASPEELARLQQQRGAFRAELRPVGGVTMHDLDRRRLRNYFADVRGQAVPDDADDADWTLLLLATEVLVEGVDGPVPSLAGLALFGRSPSRALPQSAVDCVAYPGTEQGYASLERATLRAPLTPLLDAAGHLAEHGLVDAAYDFAVRWVGTTAVLDGARRVDVPGLPREAVREVLVNAVIHRDYLLGYTDVVLALYQDRLEITSPGRLPNGVTLEGMQRGVRAARNELIKDVMRDYNYVEHMGLGIPRKVIAGMLAFNGTTPDFRLEDESLTVTLWRSPRDFGREQVRAPRAH